MPEAADQYHAEATWLLVEHRNSVPELVWRARLYGRMARANYSIGLHDWARACAVTARLMRRLARSLRRR